MLSKKIIELKQNINSVGNSYPLNYVKPDFVEKMELESNKDSFFKDTLNKMSNLVKKCNKCIEDYESISELKNCYSEAYIYSKLKAFLFIEKILESPERTPDFQIKYHGSTIYIEMKSLNMVDGNLKQMEIMNKGLDSKIDLEDQKKNGRDIAISEQIIQPYCASNKPYDTRSQKMIIETLINKITQNLKEEQFCQGDTVLLVDLGEQLPIAHPESAIREYYEVDGNKLSGVLWHTAFRNVNSKIHRVPEFVCGPNIENLHKEGVLNSSPFVKGLIFHIDEMFYALAKPTDENINVIELMYYLCPKTRSLWNN